MNEAHEHERLIRATEERERIWRAYPDEFSDGARRGHSGDHLYPPGFSAWPLERRNAWFAGFNVGYCDRKRREAHGDGK